MHRNQPVQKSLFGSGEALATAGDHWQLRATLYVVSAVKIGHC
jgi:hypothetical protein